MNKIVYKENPPTWQEYYHLFSAAGWVQTTEISENDLKKALENTFFG